MSKRTDRQAKVDDYRVRRKIAPEANGINRRMPPDGKPLVVSMSGSGTRSLMKQLGTAVFRHFDMTRSIDKLRASKHDWHIPIREPVEYLASKMGRKSYRVEQFFNGLSLMMELTEGRENTTFYPTGGLTEHVGKSHNVKNFERGRELYDLMTDEQKDFFARFYPRPTN